MYISLVKATNHVAAPIISQDASFTALIRRIHLESCRYHAPKQVLFISHKCGNDVSKSLLTKISCNCIYLISSHFLYDRVLWLLVHMSFGKLTCIMNESQHENLMICPYNVYISWMRVSQFVRCCFLAAPHNSHPALPLLPPAQARPPLPPYHVVMQHSPAGENAALVCHLMRMLRDTNTCLLSTNRIRDDSQHYAYTTFMIIIPSYLILKCGSGNVNIHLE